MTDLSRLIQDLCEGLDGPEMVPISTFVETLSTDQSLQHTDNKYLSTISSISTQKMETSDKSKTPTEEITRSSPAGVARASSYVGSVENAERVERGGKTPAETTDSLFPLTTKRVERVEREGASCERPTLDLNRVGPQRGDWWDGDHMAALAPQLLPASVPDESLPIAPAEVRAGVERELRALAVLGRTGPDALRDAIVITAAKIRNAPALNERQAHEGRCHACGEPLDGTRPEVAILQAKGGSHLWVHAGECHSEHSQRRAVRVDAIMAAAGFGADRREESAA